MCGVFMYSDAVFLLKCLENKFFMLDSVNCIRAIFLPRIKESHDFNEMCGVE